MKLLTLLFFSAVGALAQCGGDLSCDQQSCGACHYYSQSCPLPPGACAPCDTYCANLSAMAPAKFREWQTKQVIRHINNPASLTDLGRLWQLTTRWPLLPSLDHSPARRLTEGHPVVARRPRPVASTCAVANLLRVDLNRWR